MPKKQAPISTLDQFLPPGAYDMVVRYLHQYKVHLTITRERATLLGDYRHATDFHQHRISVNGNLNPYAFLITLLHELAHLLTFEQYGNRVAAHGREWKRQFTLLLHYFLEARHFPDDISQGLKLSLHNPAASSCADDHLIRILRKYDTRKDGIYLVEELPPESLFRIRGGRIFRKGEQVRKRIKCEELASGKTYLFSPVYEVHLLQES
jgi:hypothetical protein